MVTEMEMHEFDNVNNMIKYFSECDVRSMLNTAAECMEKFYAESLRAFVDKDYDRSDNASMQYHHYEVLIACLQRELMGREEMMNQNEEKLFRVIQEREKTFRERLECLGADDRMTHDAFRELTGLEEAFEVVFGRTVVDYILMKDFENKEEKNSKSGV